MNQNFIIAIDFDGTIAKHRFPQIGEPVPGSFFWLRHFQDEGAKLILWTMRCFEGSLGDVLTPALNYCRRFGVEFWGVNENPEQTRTRWSTSQKVYAHAYIDDCAAGTPVLRDAFADAHVNCRSKVHLPYVDWSKVGPHVMDVMLTMRKLGQLTIDTTELDHDNCVFSAKVDTRPHVELPTSIIKS